MSDAFGDVMVKTPVLILPSFLILSGCGTMQTPVRPAPEMTIDIVINKLAPELTHWLDPEKRPEIAVAHLLGPNNDHTQLRSSDSTKD